MGDVELQPDGAVAVMVWRHEEQNRLTTPFLKAVLDGLCELREDDRVRGVVIASGHERYWCTGLHLGWLMETSAADPEAPAEFLALIHEVLLALTGFPKPVVAALNGHTMGGGAVLAAACDYRLMRQDHGLVSLPAVKLSIPFSPGVMALLRATLPAASLRDFVYSGDRYTGVQARALGFVDLLHPADELRDAAVGLAARLGESRTATFADIKLGMRRAVLDTMIHDDPPALARTLEAFTGA